MSRLFVALLPPPDVLDEVALAVRPFHQEWPQLRWIDPALWHVTLAFLGEMPEQTLPDLDTRLSRAAARHAPMTLSFRGAGAFPSATRARLLWVGVGADPEEPVTQEEPATQEEICGPGEKAVTRDRLGKHEAKAVPRTPSGRERLKRLAASVAAGARRAGAKEVERKRFHPHLTVARTRHPGDLRELVDVMRTFSGRTWDAGAVHLVRSHLGAKVRYEPMAAYPLGRRD